MFHLTKFHNTPFWKVSFGCVCADEPSEFEEVNKLSIILFDSINKKFVYLSIKTFWNGVLHKYKWRLSHKFLSIIIYVLLLSSWSSIQLQIHKLNYVLVGWWNFHKTRHRSLLEVYIVHHQLRCNSCSCHVKITMSLTFRRTLNLNALYF